MGIYFYDLNLKNVSSIEDAMVISNLFYYRKVYASG
ncbi:hypothetical protein BHY_1151 (plasmid) [Borrelia nietonii YOR]|uniref:Uncharacterized protein n=1 Tax=Borrelia nietonii YOR TaxID=1293576 RepID=W5SAW6_9SPIR|nr:hypothetical protein BHY_1151 [Borrelia nietonii YOR]